MGPDRLPGGRTAGHRAKTWLEQGTMVNLGAGQTDQDFHGNSRGAGCLCRNILQNVGRAFTIFHVEMMIPAALWASIICYLSPY